MSSNTYVFERVPYIMIIETIQIYLIIFFIQLNMKDPTLNIVIVVCGCFAAYTICLLYAIHNHIKEVTNRNTE